VWRTSKRTSRTRRSDRFAGAGHRAIVGHDVANFHVSKATSAAATRHEDDRR
jgi:hypothetical protein